MTVAPPRFKPIEALSVDAVHGALRMTELAVRRHPFLFIIDAWARHWVVEPLRNAGDAGLAWSLPDGRGNLGSPSPIGRPYRFESHSPSRIVYDRGFSVIRAGQVAGDSYLANLTFPSLLDTDLSLEDFAFHSHASYRLHVPGRFVCFSPECFVRIDSTGRISSFPMKGTIDADLPRARERVLADSKESAEHVTIVDLIRNDLGMVADNVEVPRYRFLTQVEARGRRLLQVSSQVSGDLGANWMNRMGELFLKILPAGSVTGAPKKRTGELIRDAEGYDRGWYTGVFGVFDGESVDSAVMIRYIEKTDLGGLVYKSGGGITIYSDAEAEYSELKAKIYAPIP